METIDFTCNVCGETFPDTPDYMLTLYAGRCTDCDMARWIKMNPPCGREPPQTADLMAIYEKNMIRGKNNIPRTNTVCALCGGRLVAVGNSRKGGKPHDDWPSRQYHKKCWTIVHSREVAS